MTIIHSTIEPRKHVRVTPIGDQDVALDIGRPGRPVVRLAGIRIPVAKLRAALDADAPAGPDTRTDEEDWKARAKKAEKERDEAIRRMNDHSTNARGWMQTSEEWQATAEEWERRARAAEQPRALTARENLAALWESAHRPAAGRIPAGTAIITRSDHGNGDVRYQTLEATGRDLPDEGRTLARNYLHGPENGEEHRLLDPPARPEGAEDVTVALFQAGAAVGVKMTPKERAALADHLAAMGYRKAES